jgi:hypothetical protein
MRSVERPAFWLGPGPTPELVAARLARLAARLANRGDPREHVLLETLWSEVSPVRLVGLPTGLAGGLELIPAMPGPAPRPPSGFSPGRFFVLGAASDGEAGRGPRAAERGAPRSPGRDEPDPPAPVPFPPGAWAAAQVHWAPTGDGELWGALRAWVTFPGTVPADDRALGPLSDRAHELGGPHRWGGMPARGWAVREWERGAWRRLRPERRFRVDPEGAARLALLGGLGPPGGPDPGGGHEMVFGATGSGKSTYLLARVRERVVRGEPTAVFDVHGDLGPRLLAALGPEARIRSRLIAIDPSVPGRPPGVRLLGAAPGARDAARAHLLAALRRAGSEEGSMFWGARLDRIFDTLGRAVQEGGGGLRDLYELLVDPDRRDLARARTLIPEVASFLDELPAILRRNPEFLWPAAARLHRLVLAPHLAALVDAPDEPIDLEHVFEEGRSVFWRLPLGELGPEGSQLLVTLLASRVYLGRIAARSRSPGEIGRPLLMVLDEAHLVAPRLLAEMVTEGRKFGIRVLAATQSPERLEESARAAIAASAGTHVIFRVPRAHAPGLAPYLGWGPPEALRTLPHLASGTAWRVRSGPGGRRETFELREGPPGDDEAWRQAVRATLSELGPEEGFEGPAMSPAEERILLALLAHEPARGGLGSVELARLPSDSGPADELAVALPALRARGLIEGGPEGYAITSLGRARLGFRPATGAPSESAEHRALLLEAFRIFARHGCRIEILRQGRFDTRLPDARFRALRPEVRSAPAPVLESALRAARGGWAWRLFGGRDVHLEAEVSGAGRPDRIRHGLRKGRAAGAFTLFLVSSAERARRIRRVLAVAEGGRHEAGVWVLPRAAASPPAGTVLPARALPAPHEEGDR